MHRTLQEAGFSLAELVITTAILAILAGAAIAALWPAQRVADLRTAVYGTASAIRLKASAAASGSTKTVTSNDVRTAGDIVVNPRWPRPVGAIVTTDFALEGGTGTAYARGSRSVVAVVLAERGAEQNAWAIVAGTAGRVEVRRYNQQKGEWEMCDDR